MQEPNPDQLAKVFATLTPEESALMVKAMLDKQKRDMLPLSAGKRIPYYDEQSAAAVKPLVDKMIETKQDMEFIYDDYPCHTANTIRLKVDGGIRYLVEHDDTGKYLEWRKQVKTSRKLTDRFSIIWIRNPEEAAHISVDGSLKPRFVEKEQSNAHEQEAGVVAVVAQFIRDAKPGDYKKITGVRLTQGHIEQLEELLQPLEDEFEYALHFDRVIIKRKE